MVRSRYPAACCLLLVCAIANLAGAAPPGGQRLRTIDDVRGGKKSFQLNEIPESQCDMKALRGSGPTALAMPKMNWKHAQTDHFVVHYERKIFARKVARMAEFFYDYIAEDLDATEDRVDGRSHIFIFRSSSQWEAFMGASRATTEWAFAFVQGTGMYLQPAGNTKDSGSILAHEMTHLVLNRFFSGRPPIWLNEGLAEWYEEFGYAAFKGTKKSRRAQFRRLRYRIPVEDLVRMKSYPNEIKEVHAFYETSKFLVGYLMLKWPPAKIIPFTEDMLAGMELAAALQRHYDIGSLDELAEGFDDFVR